MTKINLNQIINSLFPSSILRTNASNELEYLAPGTVGQVLGVDALGILNYISAPYWSLTGNTGTTVGTNFIGTTDAEDFMVKTNGQQIALFGQNGNVALGSAYPAGFMVAPVASGDGSFAFGPNSISSSLFSFASSGSTASAFQTVALGAGTATGSRAIAIGSGSSANGNTSIALGDTNVADGESSVALGNFAHAYSGKESAFGTSNTSYVAVDIFGMNPLDRLVVIGNGAGVGSESDAFTILKNGQTGIGYDNFETTSFDSLLQVNGSLLSANLPSTQNDTGIFSPVNFIYSDTNGKFLSAPISVLTSIIASRTKDVQTVTGTTVTLPTTPNVLTLDVYRNGLLQEETTDYTVSGSTLTFIVALVAEKITSIYFV